MRKLPLIMVEWDDTTSHDGWKSDKDDFTKQVAHCRSVGWKLKSSRRELVITTMRDGDGKCNDRQIIPRGCIKNIKRFE